MYAVWTRSILLLTCGLLLCRSEETGEFALLMPNVRPPKPETYLCTAIKLEKKTFYITGFAPNATKETAHHMLLFGCENPGSKSAVWDCSEMTSGWSLFRRKKSSPCRSLPHILYGWAMDAPSLKLPDDVGFRIGEDTPIKYLVLQVHYATVDKFKGGRTDDSGVVLSYTDVPKSKTAGVLTMMTNGYIKPLSEEKMEVFCTIKEPLTIHPFAFRTHTHSLGKSVEGYRVRKGGPADEWTLLGRRDPQLPQMFFPVQSKNVTLRQGDGVAARCTMVNFRRRVTKIGKTNDDEMCNFYLMYWVRGPRPLQMKYCVSNGPPSYYWSQELNNIPDDDAPSVM